MYKVFKTVDGTLGAVFNVYNKKIVYFINATEELDSVKSYDTLYNYMCRYTTDEYYKTAADLLEKYPELINSINS